jgi:hypothetical protein
MKRRRCTRCRRRPVAPGHTRCRPCKNRSWAERRPAYSELSQRERRHQIARAYANVYQRMGKLKPKPRKVRGCRRRPEKHHPDYSKPLHVEWVCRPHHMNEFEEAERRRAVLGLAAEEPSEGRDTATQQQTAAAPAERTSLAAR